MKNLISYILRGSLLCSLWVINLQSNAQVSLKPGDEIPSEIECSLPRKKLIILDFWSTWCKSCINALNKLELLQETFQDDVSIIAVTNQDEKTIKAFFQKRNMQFRFLQFKTSDSNFVNYFPYISLPHTVWIMDGKVLHVTYGYNVNASKIGRVLRGEPVKMSVKDGELLYDLKAPIWAGKNAVFGIQPKRYSYLTGWLSSYGGSNNKGFTDSTDNSYCFQLINWPLKELIIKAYGTQFRYMNRVAMDDSLAKWLVWDGIYGEEDDDKRAKNLVCYELRVNSQYVSRIPKIIAADLDKFLDFDIKVEPRLVDAYVIRKIGKSNRGQQRGVHSFKNLPNEFQYSGSFSSFVAIMQQEFRHQRRPIVNGCTIDEDIEIKLPKKPQDIEDVKILLARKGFEMLDEKLSMDILILNSR